MGQSVLNLRNNGDIVSKCIDTFYVAHRLGGWRNRLKRFFVTGVPVAQGTPSAQAKPCMPAPAPAMLMASRDIGPIVSRTVERLADWQMRRQGRQHLAALDDRQLKDIGISRCDAEQEFRKPFWRA